jgi:hypothetical protein
MLLLFLALLLLLLLLLLPNVLRGAFDQQAPSTRTNKTNAYTQVNGVGWLHGSRR